MRTRTVALIAFVITALLVAASLPTHAAGAPRVVLLSDASAAAIEVAVSPKQLTLIHFDSGDVSMVAVGDTSMVNVVVRGAEVLVKALAFSGTTNAFIWVVGQYTQWKLTIRDANDPRVIIVKDGEGQPARTSGSKSNGEGKAAAPGKPVTITSAYQPKPDPGKPATQTSPPPAATQQPPAASSSTPPAAPPAAQAGSSELDQFLKSLNAKQLELFSALLQDPSLIKLSALVRELSPEQRRQLLALLAAPGALDQAGKPAARTSQSSPVPAKAPAAQAGQPAPVVAARVNTEVPAGLSFSVTPQVVGSQVFVNYVLQNQGDATVLADGLRLRVLDRQGNRLAYIITRTSQDGYVGRLSSGDVEAGVLTIDTTEKVVIVEWTLVEVGSGAQQILRAEIQVP